MRLQESKDEIDVERLKMLGKLCPLWKDGLQDIVADFLRSIASSEDGLGGNVVIRFIHAFLVQVFTTGGLSPTENIDSVLEQTALAFMIHPTHGWKPPSAMISHIMRTTKNISRAVLVHSAFLGGYHAPYGSPPVVGGEDADDVDDDDDTDEGEEGEEGEADDEIGGNADADAFGTEPGGNEVLDFDFMDLGAPGESSEDSSDTERSKGILT